MLEQPKNVKIFSRLCLEGDIKETLIGSFVHYPE